MLMVYVDDKKSEVAKNGHSKKKLSPDLIDKAPVLIRFTKDYDWFKIPDDWQRELKGRIYEIEGSMKDWGFHPGFPVICRSDGTVVDGQHRLASAKLAGVAIPFIIDDSVSIDAIRKFGYLSKAWDFQDYIHSHSKSGKEDFQWIKTYIEQHKLGVNTMMYALDLGYCAEAKKREFYSGTLSVTQEQRDFLTLLGESLNDFSKHFAGGGKDRSHTAPFAGAVIQLLRDERYDHKRMLSKLEYLEGRLRPRTTKAEYIELLEEIYNYKVGKNNEVRFTAPRRSKK